MSVSILICAILVRLSSNKVPKVWWKSKIVKRLHCDFAITVEYMVLGADSAVSNRPTGVVRIHATLSQHLKTPELQYNRYLPLLFYATMVSKTCNTVYIPATPTKKHQEIYDTIKHTRFFDAITFEEGKKSIHAIAAEVNIHYTTAYRWL